MSFSRKIQKFNLNGKQIDFYIYQESVQEKGLVMIK